MSEKVNLMWTQFQDNISMTYKHLRKEPAFTDVTLACDGNQLFEVHKLILSASSPIFNDLLTKLKNPHSVIYLRGIKGKDIASMIDFIYSGETNVHKDDLDRLLALANEFQIKGLSGKYQMGGNSRNESFGIILDNVDSASNSAVLEDSVLTDILYNSENKETKEPEDIFGAYQEKTIEDPSDSLQDVKQENINELNYQISQDTPAVHSDIDELDKTIETLMEKRKDGWACKMCKKVVFRKDHIRKHTEKHIEGIKRPCPTCGKTFKSLETLAYHRSKSHREIMDNTQFRINTKETLDKDYDEDELEKKIALMMEKRGDIWACKACERISSRKDNLYKHAEKHIEGIKRPCTICGKTYKSTDTLQYHKSAAHKIINNYNC